MNSALCCLAVIFFIVIQTHQLKWQINPLDSIMQDQFGRLWYRMIHGVNVIYKQKPFIPNRQQFNYNDSLVREDFQNLEEWGFTSIRLFVSWQGFQPRQGQYNYTYLEQLRSIVRQAQAYNISILLDSHQDLFSKSYCGEGFPTWLTKVTNFPSPIHADLQYDKEGYPTKQSCMKIPFFKFYLSEDVMRFSHQFFTNKNGILDKFICMWEKVVMFFLLEGNVIGYDIINQPSGVNLYQSAYEYLGPGMDNNKFLLPFYKKISKAIRRIDKTKFLYFEPAATDFLGGFYDSPSQEPFKKLDVMSYHTYCPFATAYGSKRCDNFNQFYTNKKHENARNLKIALSMTEFGSVSNSESDIIELINVMNMTESKLTGWYYWQFKYNSDSTSSTHPPQMQSFYQPDGKLQYSKVKALSHPYAYAICGINVIEDWDDHYYSLNLQPKNCSGKLTEIFINEGMYFSSGFEVQFRPKCQECFIRAVKDKTKSYFEVVFSKEWIHKQIELRIVGRMQKEFFD